MASVFKARDGRDGMSHCISLTLLSWHLSLQPEPGKVTFKDSYNETEPSIIVQDNLLILKSIPLITSASPFCHVRLPIPRFQGFKCGPLGGPSSCHLHRLPTTPQALAASQPTSSPSVVLSPLSLFHSPRGTKSATCVHSIKPIH